MADEHNKSYGAAVRKSHERRLVFSLVWTFVALAFLSAVQGSIAAGQQLGSPRLGEAVQGSSEDMGAMDSRLAARQIQLLNLQRQKMIVSDTDKLLKLAMELKAEIDVGDSASLSPEQLHKISEIEKLARSVKQKMTITVGGGPPLRDLFFSQ